MEHTRYRAVVEYLLKKGYNGLEIHEDLVKTYSTCAVSYATVKRWICNMKRGNNSLQKTSPPRRPKWWWKTGDSLAGILAKHLTYQRQPFIKFYLQMTKVSAIRVPHLLMFEQKLVRKNQSYNNLSLFNKDPDGFHARFVTVDETWVHHFTPESKMSSMQWKHTNSPPPKKARVTPSAGKVMATFFWG